MDIVIIAEFFGDFSKTDNDRFLYIANMLSEDNSVELVTSGFQHNAKCHRYRPKAKWDFQITFIDEPGYSKNVCVKRLFSHYIWGRNIFNYVKSRRQPDVIYCAVPSLTGPNFVSKYCKKENIKFIIDVQDLWPEAFQMAFNVPVLRDVLFYPLKKMADSIYSRADAVIAVSKSYVDRALRVNNKKPDTAAIYLGTDVSVFDSNARNNRKYKKNKNEIWLSYCGTLGDSYDISLVIDALSLISDEDNIRFVIMGSGPKENEYRKYAYKKHIKCSFMGRLPYEEMCGMLVASDIVINPIVRKSVATIINKHADYAACGLPVINTQKDREYRKLVEDYKMGINCDTMREVADAIVRLASDATLRQSMGEGARRCAEEKLDRRKTYGKIVDMLR